MKQELSAVIACMQQIELVCMEIEMFAFIKRTPVLEDLREKVRKFFEDPTVESAQDVLTFMRRQQMGMNCGLDGTDILNTHVQIDGAKENLEHLADELDELIKDFSNSNL